MKKVHPLFQFSQGKNEFSHLSFQALESRCSTWLHTDVEYQLEPNVIHLFPEKHNHQKLLLYHNIAAPHTYRYSSMHNVSGSKMITFEASVMF